MEKSWEDHEILFSVLCGNPVNRFEVHIIMAVVFIHEF